MTENDKFFQGRTEKFLWEKLQRERLLRFEVVYGMYSNKDAARAFLNKLLTMELVDLSHESVVLREMRYS